LTLVKTQKHAETLSLKQFICKNCSYQGAYDCAQLRYIICNNTAQNSSENFPSYPPDENHSSDVV